MPEILPTRQHGALKGRRSVPLDQATVAGFDAVLIVTDHDAIDWPGLKADARLLIDTRGRYPDDPDVVRA